MQSPPQFHGNINFHLLRFFHLISLFFTKRASKALFENSPSAEHELLLATTFASLAFLRISRNEEELTMIKLHSNIETIADQVFEAKKFIPKHPTGID